MQRLAPALLAVLAIAFLAGCTRVGTCKTGTLLLEIKLPAALASATALRISITIGSGATQTSTVARGDRLTGTVQVDFNQYPAGQSATVEVAALVGADPIATARTTLTLPSGCARATIVLGGGAGDPDLSATATDLPPGDDGSSNTCQNNSLDTGESDVDCGGPCPACAAGKTCTSGPDCISTICNPTTQKCVGGPCENGLRDNDETDIDCGGATCNGCGTGKACVNATDCTNDLCNLAQMICVASTCEDGAVDGTETDLDCGGGCPTKCKTDQSCLSSADCASPGACDGTKHCIAAQCTNSTQDAANASTTPPIAAETDVDCGGTVCKTCGLGKMCQTGADCANGFCNASTKVCVANQCLDGIKNGSESDVDCGGSCTTKCATGKMCSGPTDCAASGAVCTGSLLCCVPSCSGKICGSDGCGGSCGSCTSATTPMCNAGGSACLCSGSSCASLGAGYICNGSGACACSTGTTESCFDGIDNNCDGLIDCADPQCGSSVAVCVNTAPGGYTYGRKTPAASCTNGTSSSLITSVSSPSACTGCGCTPFGQCTSAIYSDQNGAGNCSTPTTSTTYLGSVSASTTNANGTCLANATLQNQMTAVTTWSGSCNSSGAASKPALNFMYQDYCTVSTVGGGCGVNKVCVPAGNTCVKGVGSCSGYATSQTVYTSYDDSTRSCTACAGCTVSAAGDCNSSSNSGVNRLLGYNCDMGGNSQNSNSSSCFGGNVFHSVSQYAFSGVSPTCGGAGSATVTGSATLTGATSICCN